MLGRLLTAMITPFDGENRLAVDEAVRLAQWLIDQGNDGLVLAGSTGEGATLSVDERMELFSAIAAAVGDRASLVAGTGGNDTQASIALTKRAAETGIDAILAVVPYYNKPTQSGMLRHFSAIAESTQLPIVVYNIPSRTGVNMLPATLLELARRYPNIVGVKESSGDFSQFTDILRERPPGFRFWIGDDPLLLPSLAIGGDGIISVAGHICARELREIILAVQRGDLTTASSIHRSLSPLFTALFATTNPIPVKWAMRHLGFNVGVPRLPLLPLEPPLDTLLESLLVPYRSRTESSRVVR